MQEWVLFSEQEGVDAMCRLRDATGSREPIEWNVQVEAADECRLPLPDPDSKVYVLVRRDLPWPVRTVQAVHAVMQLLRYAEGLRQEVQPWGRYGPSVVLLGVANEAELKTWPERMPWGALVVGFCEPDLGGELTALAYYGAGSEALHELRLM